MELSELNAKTGDFHFAADALLRRGQAQLHAGYTKEADDTFQQALAILQKHKHKTMPYRLLLRLRNYRALALMEIGEYKEAHSILLKECLPVASNHCSDAAVASVRNRLAVVCCKLSNGCDEAYGHIIAALQTRVNLGMFSEAARSLVTLGTVHELRNELPQAVLVWNLSLSWQQALRDHENTAPTWFRVGLAYARLYGTMSSPKLACELLPEFFPNSDELNLLKRIAKDTSFTSPPITRSRLLFRAKDAFQSCIDAEESDDDQKYSLQAEIALERLSESANSGDREKARGCAGGFREPESPPESKMATGPAA